MHSRHVPGNITHGCAAASLRSVVAGPQDALHRSDDGDMVVALKHCSAVQRVFKNPGRNSHMHPRPRQWLPQEHQLAAAAHSAPYQRRVRSTCPRLSSSALLNCMRQLYKNTCGCTPTHAPKEIDQTSVAGKFVVCSNTACTSLGSHIRQAVTKARLTTQPRTSATERNCMARLCMMQQGIHAASRDSRSQ